MTIAIVLLGLTLLVCALIDPTYTRAAPTIVSITALLVLAILVSAEIADLILM